MRSYSESVSPSSRCGAWLGDAHFASIVAAPAGLGAPAASERASSRARPRARAPRRRSTCERHSSTRWPTRSAVEEARLAAGLEPWKASAERIWASSSAWRSKSITGNGSASSSSQERPVVGHPELLPAGRRRAAGWRSARSRARRSSDLRTATGFRITPIGLGSRSRQSSRTTSIRGSLTPIVAPGNRAQDLVAPAEVAALQTRLGGRVPPGAAASLEDRVVQLVELADLAVAAGVEAGLARRPGRARRRRS